MGKYYVLKGKKAVPVGDVTEWAKQFDGIDRIVAKTDIKNVRISTVFLGLDHQWGVGTPLIFETLVFGGKFDQEMDRYSTWEEAEEGHKKMVTKVKEVTTDE